jgi:hypothetical protein
VLDPPEAIGVKERLVAGAFPLSVIENILKIELINHTLGDCTSAE